MLAHGKGLVVLPEGEGQPRCSVLFVLGGRASHLRDAISTLLIMPAELICEKSSVPTP